MMKTRLGQELGHFRDDYSDWLLTVLTVLLLVMIFVFTPLQAAGLAYFQGLAILGLPALILGVLVISASRVATAAMLFGLATNIIIIVERLYWPSPYDLHAVAAAWLLIAVTLGVVVAKAVFAPGRVTYHRIVGAVLLYLLIALTFVVLFTFVGLSFPDAFKGIKFEYHAGLASELLYLSFVTLTSTGYGDIVPIHPFARSLCNIEAVIGQLFPATLLARLVTLELSARSQ